MSKRSQILEALVGGMLTQAKIESATGLSDLKFTLGGLVKIGQVTKDARGPDGKFTLAGGAKAKKQPAKKKVKAKRGAGGGRVSKKPKVKRARIPRSPRAARPAFRALMAHGASLVLLRGGELEEFTADESLEIFNALSCMYVVPD